MDGKQHAQVDLLSDGKVRIEYGAKPSLRDGFRPYVKVGEGKERSGLMWGGCSWRRAFDLARQLAEEEAAKFVGDWSIALVGITESGETEEEERSPKCWRP